MFHELDQTLRVLLRRELAPELLQQVPTISFAAPDESFPPAALTLPAINFFLYELRENSELRGFEQVMERQGGGEEKLLSHRHPAWKRVDCHYLVCAIARADAQAADEQELEHRILGDVLRVLLRHPELPAQTLQGRLREQPWPLPTRVLQPFSSPHGMDPWLALKCKPRASFQYTVTLGFSLGEEEPVPVVREVLTQERA
ncbi:DUF4255 domain-containing protein [Corallococcus sp. 4LFB]|uniref:DUF4255 domain-containing protein n=1 Tax=Corallococcus sp. 4LFB TaxID=3383249 RepID=UPI0039771B81